ncbi:MAG: hypothetical protein AVDCRST_MAG85-3423 [uncultured Solirubrobacteraceae bacterium]|uniref:Uncharacterized protein n=1 Tax=uncultured Solirubrobacteraceae bacterium TaxID=1162706 RepID=A0A6J4TNX6_9ACTN|nr:MAG: hypothetical protein AVDCRST_MAG85-3423 [uncultured Solirubrobacteraceae bacterium]
MVNVGSSLTALTETATVSVSSIAAPPLWPWSFVFIVSVSVPKVFASPR